MRIPAEPVWRESDVSARVWRCEGESLGSLSVGISDRILMPRKAAVQCETW